MKKTTLLTALLFAFATNTIAQCPEMPLPYQENFDTAELPYLPDCTYSVKQMFGGNDWETVVAPNNNFTGNVARYDTNALEDIPSYCYYFTRQVELTAGMAYKISYKYAHDSSETTIDRLSTYMYYNSPDKIDIASHEDISGTDVINYSSQLFTVPSTETYSLYFDIESQDNQGILYLDDIKIEEMGVMNTSDIKMMQLTCHPNPVKDMLTIENDSTLESVQLYNPTVQLLLTQVPTENTTTIDFNSLPTGIYFLQARSKQSSKTIPIVRQ